MYPLMMDKIRVNYTNCCVHFHAAILLLMGIAAYSLFLITGLKVTKFSQCFKTTADLCPTLSSTADSKEDVFTSELEGRGYFLIPNAL